MHGSGTATQELRDCNVNRRVAHSASIQSFKRLRHELKQKSASAARIEPRLQVCTLDWPLARLWYWPLHSRRLCVQVPLLTASLRTKVAPRATSTAARDEVQPTKMQRQSSLCCFPQQPKCLPNLKLVCKSLCPTNQELLFCPQTLQKCWCKQVIAARVDTGLDVEVTYSYKVGPLVKGSGASPHQLTCILELTGHAPTGMHGSVLEYGSMG